MKFRVKTFALCVIAIAVAVGIALPQQSFAASDAKKPKATNVQYVTDDSGKKTGIRTFTIAPFTYYNLSQDPVINKDNERTFKLNDAKLLQIAKRQIFPKWGIIAEGIFRDQAEQLVTIEGSGMMSSSTTSKNSFDRHFSTGKVSNGYDYDWAVSDLAQALGQENSSHKGKTCWDETRITGVTQIGNLSDARTLMGQELRNCSDDNDVSKDDFLGNSYQKTEDKRRLPDLEQDKTGDGFANIVTCVNRAGASGDYDYVSFGVAVYDFDITPVAAENLKYIEAADEDFTDESGTVSGKDILMGLAGDHVNKTGISFHNDDENGTTSYLRNNTTQEVTQSSGLENSVTEESTIGTDDTFEWGMEQEIGVEINLGGFGQGLMPGGGVDAFANAAPCMFPRATLSFSNSWHELWSTTNSKSETQSSTKTKTTNTEVTLPGHTIAVVKQSLNNKKTTENYQQPVILNYKVAVFAMSGDYFNGSAGGIENSRYDKQWMSVIFDGSDDYETSGCNALGSLYNRAVINRDTQGYDGAKGKYRSWCDKSAWNSSSKINWSSISATLSGDSRPSHNIQLGTGKSAITIQDLATELPLIEKAQMLTSKRESVTSSVDEIIPLYSLDSVSMKSGSKEYDLVPRDTLHLDSIDMEGYDRDGAEFYEFDKSWGEWVLLDEDNEVIEDNGDSDESPAEGEIRSGAITIVNDTLLGSQKAVIANEAEGTSESHYLKWRLKPGDDTKISSNEELNRPDGSDDPAYMTDEEKENVDTPVILVNIKDRDNDIVNFETDGTYKGPWNETVNLGHVLTADAVDASGKIRGVSVLWESKGTSGISVDASGETTFTRKGTYKVRPYSYNMEGKKIVPTDKSGDPVWMEVTAQDKATLGSIVIDKPDFEAEDTTLSEGTTALGFDLGSYTKYFDQYGDKWGGTEEEPLPEVRYSVSGASGAVVDRENILTVTEPGTYTINAKAYDEDGNEIAMTIKPIRITVTEESRLTSITMDKPALSKSQRTLKDQDDCIIVENLKGLLTYTDQHNDEWTGKKPVVTFSLDGESKDAEIRGGNFYAYAPGTYTINASAAGYSINSISIVIEEDQHLVLKAEDPGRQYLYTDDDEVELELERYINATTRFGGKYKGDVPELKFTMDDTEGASIETRTVYESDDDYDGTDRHFFSTSTTGEYFVHVQPQKASAYTEPIDDIFIRVVRGKKVARIEFRDISEEEEMTDFVLNSYTGEQPSFDLDQYLNYYDGFGDLIDPANDHVKIPDCDYSLMNPEKYNEDDYQLKGDTFTAKAADFYIIKAIMNVTNNDPSAEEPEEDTILETAAGFMIYDIDWFHDFGDWEVTKAPTCGEEGIRVKRCSGGEGCMNHEEGIECDAEIVDTIPATGHKWDRHYRYSRDDHTLYTVCKVCGTVNEDSITSCRGTPDNGWIGSPDNNIPIPYQSAGCETERKYRIRTTDGQDFVTVPPIGHSWSGSYTVTKEPKCSETGLEVIKCEACSEVRNERILAKTAHVPDETKWEYLEEDGTVYKESCEDYGIKVAPCRDCGALQYDFIAPTGHNWGEGVVETEPTCTKEGSKWIECTTCHTVKDGSETSIPVIPHEYPTDAEGGYQWDTEVAPTCDEAGYKEVKCMHCDNVMRVEIEPTGHEYGQWTKLDDEQHQRVCENDAAHIEKADHQWNDGEITRAATCEQDGVKTFTCETCGATKTEAIPATGHDWDEWTEAKASTCVKKGQEVRVCDHNSNHKEYRDKDYGKHDPTMTPAKNATCTNLGNIKYYTCDVCGCIFKDEDCTLQIDEEDTVIPATGHDFGAWTRIDDEQHQRVCNHNAGHVEKADHKWNNGVVTKAATCDADGSKTLTCELCGATKTEVIPRPVCKLSKKTYTYNGKAKKPAVTVKDTKGKTIGKANYSISYSNNTKAGKAIVKVTFKGTRYTGVKTLEFTIKKAANPLKIKAKTVTVSYSKVKKKSQKLKASKVISITKKGQGSLTYTKASGSSKITISKKTGTVSVKKGLKKGTYKVKVKVRAAGNANYKASGIKNVTFTLKVK